jgi:hypothetical protein
LLLYEDKLRRTAAFLCVDEDSEEGVKRVPMGTAFFVGFDVGYNGYLAMYAVTARHNIELSVGSGPLYLRVNERKGDYRDLEVPQPEWTAHPASDVAIRPVAWLPWMDHAFITGEDMVRRGDHASSVFKAGDDVIMAGLFRQRFGTRRMEPILRFGNIALMPGSPLSIELPLLAEPLDVEAILIEARSWGGQSGSPVMVDRSKYGGPGPMLLGLIHGHDVEKDVDATQGVKVSMNAGVAIVIPAQHILETLALGEVVDMRNEEVHKLREREASDPSPELDSEPPGSDAARTQFFHGL